MSKPQIDLSPDLKQLRDEGYDLDVRAKYLLVRSVPYVNAHKQVCRGTMVTELNWSGDVTTTPRDHVVHFIGEQPCHQNGTEIAGIKNPTGRQELDTGLVVDRLFSAKPVEGKFPNFYEKIKRYVEILGGPALAIDPTAKAQVFAPIECTENESVFHYFDTASSRAGISGVTHRLEMNAVAIVGVGGTGSYILDLLAKTPVKEIHLFDNDDFLNHNAFRSPGAASLDDLRRKPKKVIYLSEQYARMRRGIVPHVCSITNDNVEQLRNMAFVFLSMDGGPDKRTVITHLQEWQIPFVDVGMGLALENGAIGGIVTATTSTTEKSSHASSRISTAAADGDNDYSRNIQVADLNALNAVLAVIKWKKVCGFYHDFPREHFCAYTVDGNKLVNEELA